MLSVIEDFDMLPVLSVTVRGTDFAPTEAHEIVGGRAACPEANEQLGSDMEIVDIAHE